MAWGMEFTIALSRGTEMVYPMDTPAEITLGSHGDRPEESVGQSKTSAETRGN